MHTKVWGHFSKIQTKIAPGYQDNRIFSLANIDISTAENNFQQSNINNFHFKVNFLKKKKKFSPQELPDKLLRNKTSQVTHIPKCRTI